MNDFLFNTSLMVSTAGLLIQFPSSFLSRSEWLKKLVFAFDSIHCTNSEDSTQLAVGLNIICRIARQYCTVPKLEGEVFMKPVYSTCPKCCNGSDLSFNISSRGFFLNP